MKPLEFQKISDLVFPYRSYRETLLRKSPEKILAFHQDAEKREAARRDEVEVEVEVEVKMEVGREASGLRMR